MSTTGTLGFGGEADVIIAKASPTESISLTLGASWSSTSIYSKPVPKGKTARLVLFHESRSFDVRKWRPDAHCNAQTIWTRHANAPRKSHAYNVWDLQYL